jgi:hypothetical protein
VRRPLLLAVEVLDAHVGQDARVLGEATLSSKATDAPVRRLANAARAISGLSRCHERVDGRS